MSVTKNNHYISKFLLQPWEYSKGKVRILNYRTEKIEEVDSETLFSKTGIFSQSQENFFNKYIETINRQELSTIHLNDYKTKKWKNYRAIVLFMWDLVGRHKAATTGDNSFVEFFTSLQEPQLDQFALTIDQKFLTSIVTVPASCALSFPSNLLLFAFDPATGECNFGFPFDGRSAIFAINKNTDMKNLEELTKSHFFCNIALGNDATDFVVMHPSVTINDEVIKSFTDQRRLNQQISNQIGEARGTINDLYQSFGIKK